MKKIYKSKEVTFDATKDHQMTRGPDMIETIDSKPGAISGWIDGNYFSISVSKIRKALMEKKSGPAEWIHIIKATNKKIQETSS